ncbi:MAG: ASCH domain-containing protein [Myxococcaceae bacterium]|nr:ASCH domain-containing protein [Myxococcaceae bacterium]
MLLFQKRFHAGLVSGAVTRTFRLWDKPHVKPGGRYRVHPIGVVEVDGLRRVTLDAVSDEDARLGGFTSREELREYLAPVAKAPLTGQTLVFDITLRHAGDGDRVQGALDAKLSADDVRLLQQRLARLDGSSPWTMTVLKLIKRRPRVAASKLAASLGRDTLPFKEGVRKLKRLGLTQSFEVGYEVSPRGLAFMKAAGRTHRQPRAPDKTARRRGPRAPRGRQRAAPPAEAESSRQVQTRGQLRQTKHPARRGPA